MGGWGAVRHRAQCRHAHPKGVCHNDIVHESIYFGSLRGAKKDLDILRVDVVVISHALVIFVTFKDKDFFTLKKRVLIFAYFLGDIKKICSLVAKYLDCLFICLVQSL